MSIWGKIIGGTAGFALGGPLGAILGMAAGHGMDKASMHSGYKKKNKTLNNSSEKQYKEQIFATGVIVIAAKLSKADGKVTNDEIQTFKKIFKFPKEDEKNIADLFNAAKTDTNGYQIYAAQLYDEFKSDKHLLIEILNSLFAIAYSDKKLHPNEEKIIYDISNIFNFSLKEFESIKNVHNNSSNKSNENLVSYYKVLGVESTDSIEEITKTYKKVVKEYHPDRLQGLGLPKDFVELANKKMAMMNEAYNEIKKSRK